MMTLSLDKPVLVRGVSQLTLDREIDCRRVNRMERITLGRETSSSECDALSQGPVSEVSLQWMRVQIVRSLSCTSLPWRTQRISSRRKLGKHFVNTIVLKLKMEFRQHVLVLQTVNLGKTPDGKGC